MQILWSSANIKPDTNVSSSPFKLEACWPSYVLLLQKTAKGSWGKRTVKQQMTGVKIQSAVTCHTHIFFDILRFDSLV